MNVRRLLPLSFLLFMPLPALAGSTVTINIGWEAPPPMIVIHPGVQVVENYGEEVFFVDGYYWVERDGSWYHCRDHHGKWIFVERSRVSVWLVDHPRGHYKHWKREKQVERHDDKRPAKNGNGNGKGNGNKKGKGHGK